MLADCRYELSTAAICSPPTFDHTYHCAGTAQLLGYDRRVRSHIKGIEERCTGRNAMTHPECMFLPIQIGLKQTEHH